MTAVAVRRRLGVDTVGLVGRVVETLGGRYSTGLGIEVDGGEAEVERWFVAATLFGSRISASVAERTFTVLDGAGLTRIAGARDRSWDALVALLDEGGYARYDFRTATRLQALADIVCDRYNGRVGGIGEAFTTYPALHEALDALPRRAAETTQAGRRASPRHRRGAGPWSRSRRRASSTCSPVACVVPISSSAKAICQPRRCRSSPDTKSSERLRLGVAGWSM